MATTPMPTITTSCTVTHRYSGSTVAAISRRICADSAFHCVHDPTSASTGSDRTKASNTRSRAGSARKMGMNRFV